MGRMSVQYSRQGSSGGMVTTTRAGHPRIHCSISGSGKRLCFPPKHQSWLSSLASLPSNVDWGFSLLVYSCCRSKLTTCLYLVPWLMSGAVPAFRHMLTGSARGKLCFVMKITYVYALCIHVLLCMCVRTFLYFYVCKFVCYVCMYVRTRGC